MDQPRMFKFGVTILAAGRSSRMGRPKLLLPWGTTTVVGQIVQVWQSLAASQIAPVCRIEDHPLASELDRAGIGPLQRIHNPDPDQGMFRSIRCASAWGGWHRQLTHFVLALGDQPHLRRETLAGLLNFGAVHPGNICQPCFSGRAAHPVLLPKAAFLQLANSGAGTLKEFLSHHPVENYETDDTSLELDLDSPADYEKARRLFAC